MSGPVGGDQGFNADPDEIDAHARRVGEVQAQLDTALDAANQRMGEEAFGKLGALVASCCNSSLEELRATLQAATESSQHHVDLVRKWAEVKRVDEDSIGALLKKAGE
ncbi:hypothetical protein [Amycolatopsis albispora]|uniref:Uncharacterized protein n=1 Tax=Amycolatopsis albispora TaxID=1804986 RepID=A0A344LF72_9PSEU|nr:hypothetical protein [Amycolatopsis albispora]AXB46696.1 hypothetical protein A4R43_33175 [Amycolatopsis albispora]